MLARPGRWESTQRWPTTFKADDSAIDIEDKSAVELTSERVSLRKQSPTLLMPGVRPRKPGGTDLDRLGIMIVMLILILGACLKHSASQQSYRHHVERAIMEREQA